jgi:hypothetical protein
MRTALAAVAAAWLVLGAGCSGMSGCSMVAPLPAPLPPDQVIEGAMQVRVTPSAFTKLSQAAPAAVAALMQNGLCVPEQKNVYVGVFGDSADACDQMACPGSATPGCLVHFNLQRLDFDLPDGDTMKVAMTFDVDAPLAVTYYPTLGDPSTCTYEFQATGAQVAATIRFGINDTTGELEVHLDHVDHLDLSDSSVSSPDCGLIGDILAAVWDFATGMMADWLTQLISPLFDALIQQFLPQPLGLEGLLDLKQAMGLVSQLAPDGGTSMALDLEGKLEMKVVPGGWAELRNGGLSMGVIGGLNSDLDPTTRVASRDPKNSEPAPCVPVNPTPDLAARGLAQQATRHTFVLDRLPELAGTPETASDLLIGVAQPYLDLGGFHAINSGAVCLAVGTSVIELLNVGALGIIVPSLALLTDSAQAPMLIVLRPRRPVTFAIGAGTTDDPSLRLLIPEMEADLYAWLEERYVRAFTLGLDLRAGLNLAVVPGADGQPALQPTLLGIDPANVVVTVYNTDLIAESAADLEQVLPNLLVLISSALGGALQPFALPTVGGWGLSELTLGKLEGPTCDFLTIGASLAEATTPPPPPPATTTAQVVGVRNPPAEAVRAAWRGRGGEPPSVALRLGADGAGPFEWQLRIDGGLWRPFAAAPEVTVTDPAFALQGRHRLEVRARRAGDWRSLDPRPVALEVLIDSLPPSLHPRVAGGRLDLGGRDLVSPPARLRYAVWRDGTWQPLGADGGLQLAAARAATRGGRDPLRVSVTDEAGNETHGALDLLALTGDAPRAGGCAAARAAPGRGAAALGLALLLGALAARRRRGRVPALALLGLLAALGAGCNCGGHHAVGCTTDEECAGTFCTAGTIPLCGTNGQCYCGDDIPLGPVGRYAAAALAGSTVYVAAYNEKHGDLMLATATKGDRVTVDGWEYLDGVPDGPVVLPPPAQRGGVRASGDDVGRFCSIGVADPLVSIAYYDRTHGALRFGQRPLGGGAWRWHVVDQSADAEDTGPKSPGVGRFAALALRSDGAPAIAYSAVTESGGAWTGALRYAASDRPDPQGPSDWKIVVADQAPMTAPAATTPEDLPNAVGVMPALVRLPSGAPVIAYYDRPRGNLLLVRWDATLGRFAAPAILDGETDGEDTGNVGQSPSLALAGDGTAHVAYIDMGRDYGHRLMYVTAAPGGAPSTPEVVDDGYRSPDPDTDPLGSPVFHFVGDSSAIVLVSGAPVVAYQDSTALELRVAQRRGDGTWQLAVVAGDEDPFAGAYGFYARMIPDGGNVVISTYVIDQKADPAQYYVELFWRQVSVE